jgi:hypothetical protein
MKRKQLVAEEDLRETRRQQLDFGVTSSRISAKQKRRPLSARNVIYLLLILAIN